MMTPHSTALCAGLGFMALLTAADASERMDSVDDTPPDALPIAQPPPADAASGGESMPFPSVRGIIPANIFDPDSVAWSSRRDMSSSAFSSWFGDLMANNYMIIDIEVDEVSGSQQVAGVWQDNIDNRGWAEYRNMTSSQFSAKWDELEEDGYRLIDQEIYQLNGSWYYAGIWVECPPLPERRRS